ncbi:MAG: hypothetical protein NT051_01985 [Candidatus Micrarchaeota archaeon]|nr:hypothetical protein [Candidatus Micrarchaeota archaeon]
MSGGLVLIRKELRDKIKTISKEGTGLEKDHDSEYAVRCLKFGRVPVDLPTLKEIGQGIEKAKLERGKPYPKSQLNSDSQHILLQFEKYFPAFTDLHVSYAPPGMSFREASENGKLVSVYNHGSRTSSLVLPETARGKNGKLISVMDARDHIIIVKIELIDKTPSITYSLNSKETDYEIQFSKQAEVYCLPFPQSSGRYIENFLGIPTFVAPAGYKGELSYLSREETATMNTVLVCSQNKEAWLVLANFTGMHHFGMLAYQVK